MGLQISHVYPPAWQIPPVEDQHQNFGGIPLHFPDADHIPHIREHQSLALPILSPPNPHPQGYPTYIKIYFYDPRPFMYIWQHLDLPERVWIDNLYTLCIGTISVLFYIDRYSVLETYYDTYNHSYFIGETRYKIIIRSINYTPQAVTNYHNTTSTVSPFP